MQRFASSFATFAWATPRVVVFTLLFSGCVSDVADQGASAPAIHRAPLLGDSDDPFLVTAPGAVSAKSTAAGSSLWYRLTVPSTHAGLRIAVRSTGQTDVRVRRDGPTAAVLATSSDRTLHTIFFTAAQTTADDAWWIEVAADVDATIDVAVEPTYARALSWDAGDSLAGETVTTPDASAFGDFLYTISPRAARFGVWRNVLRVTRGEADLLLAQNTFPSDGVSQASTVTGSDAYHLYHNEYAESQTWFVRVRAGSGDAQWSLVSGDIYVTDFGPLSDTRSQRALTLDVGGVGWFRTEATAQTLAWRLFAPDATFHIAKTLAPLPRIPSSAQLRYQGQGLVVPDYLVAGGYLVAVIAATPTVNVDSGNQVVIDPATAAGGNGSAFDFTLSSGANNGFGYVSFKVEVPVQQIAWQVTATSTQGECDLYVARGRVPSELDNEGLSEIVGIPDSVTFVPPSLTNGTFYVTVKGQGDFTFTLTSGNPVITPISFVDQKANGAQFEARSGWRYFIVADIESQVGALGWVLDLAGHVSGTEIALRRNAVPGRRRFRDWNYYGSTYIGAVDDVPISSDKGFLERPNHPADIWYIGIYQPNAALGPFTLTTSTITATTLAFDGGALQISGQASGRWRYYKVTVPLTTLGWDLQLDQVTGGSPRMVVRAESIPSAFGDVPACCPPLPSRDQWDSGQQWSPSADFTRRNYTWVSDTAFVIDETGRRLFAGMGNPVREGVFYIGVSDLWTTTDNGPLTYRLRSRAIGTGSATAIPIIDLPFSGGEVSVSGASPRDVFVYRVEVPPASPSFGFELESTRGEAALGVRRSYVPSSEAGQWYSSADSTSGRAGARRQRKGREYYYRYPDYSDTSLPGGTYYLVVGAEGAVTAQDGYTRGGTTDFTLRSLGHLPVLGDVELDPAGALSFTGQQLKHGQQRAYRFSVPEGVVSIEVALTATAGRPSMDISHDAFFPTPSQNYVAAEGGHGVIASNSGIITIPGPSGTYTILVTAQNANTQPYEPDATFDLSVTPLADATIAFNGGTAAIVSQGSQTWRYFRVTVPDDALGWDLRLRNIQSGKPRIVIRRDELPANFSTAPGCCPPLPHRDAWNTGEVWAPQGEYTQRNYAYYNPTTGVGGTDEAGRAVVMGLGTPIQAGNYVIGVSDTWTGATGDSLSYELVSRAIGIGADPSGTRYDLQVADLAFAGGSATGRLAPREAAFYRVVVPEGAASWHVTLTPTLGDAMLALRKGALPNSDAGNWYNQVDQGAGASRRKVGADYYYRYPTAEGPSIPSGVHYLAVGAEGVGAYSTGSYIGQGDTTFTLTSHGQVQVDEAAEPLGAEALAWTAQSAEYGQQRAYRFQVPAGVTSMEVRLENRVGNPIFSIGRGKIPTPNQSNYYAAEGGDTGFGSGSEIITITEPLGIYTVLVTAGYASPGGEIASSWDLTVTPIGETPLSFNGGSVDVTGQASGTWRYFRVNVPAGPLGWDLRLRNVTSGRPRIVIRRDDLPEGFYTNPGCCPGLSGRGRWDSGWTWAPSGELTGRNYSAYDPQTGQGGQDEYGRAVSMGMGTPLQPGAYIVGVSDIASPGTTPMAYRLVSRGIGVGSDAEGTPYGVQVRDLAFAGTAEIVDLQPREHAYFRVQVPPGFDSWSLELETVVGEAMMAVREGGVPNTDAGAGYPSDDTNYRMGARFQKVGREFFYKLPWYDTRPATGRTFYVGVGSEGQNPYSTSSYIGTGTVSARLHFNGPVPVVGGTDIVVENAPYTFEDQRLSWGQHKYYRVRVPPTVDAFEVRLANRVGSPTLVAGVDAYFESRFPASNNYSYYASEGGAYARYADPIATQVVDETGDVTIVVHAQGGSIVDNEYDLVITPVPTRALAWDGGDESVVLKDKEVAWFRVEVPADCDETAQAGWIVTQQLIRGQATIEVRKGNLPGAATGGQTLTTTARQTVIVPPFLSPGTWYVAVRATGNTEIRLKTEEVRAARQWTMPTRGSQATTAGLNHPFFGDTGVDDAGAAIVNPGSGDQGADLGEGLYRFYRLTVPANNGGLFRTRLEAISGDPELYIRRGAAPTLAQMPGVYSGLVDYSDTQDGSSYGHWVTADTRYGEALAPGDYWIAVYAQASNVRYRLSLDVGVVNDLAASGGSISGHALAAGDMRFYRVTIPNTSTTAGQGTPVDWTLTLTQESGDALVLIREEVPPGLWSYVPTPGSADYYLRDWNGDRSAYVYGLSTLPNLDATGSKTLSAPIIRPGATYWLGVYARSDTVYNLSSATSAARVQIAGILPFTGNRLTTSLTAGASKTYRVDVPADAGRWLHTATVADGVKLYLSASYVPPQNGYADWTNSGYASSSGLDRNLDAPGGYAWNFPWVPNVSYYLVMDNTTASTQAIEINLDGRLYSDDSDSDGLPDGWEYKYFASLYYGGAADYDGDFLTNAEELAAGSNPALRDTDGDGLEDGAEVLAGADPLLADTDGDGACDGSDSAPDDPNESGPVIRLVMHRWEGGTYGHGFGSNVHRTRLVAVFDRASVLSHWVHVTGYDVTAPDEVEVLLNGEHFAYLPAGSAGQTSRPVIFMLPDERLLPSGRDNRLELRQKTVGATWGVRDLGLFTYGESFGFDPTRAYDARHPNGIDFVIPSLADSWMELRAFDLEAATDVTVSVNGMPFLDSLEAGGDRRWTNWLQVPLLAAAVGAGPVRLSFSPRAGTDGAWQVRLMALRPLLTTFGTEVNRGEGDHLTHGVRFLLPPTSGVSQLALRLRVSDGESVTMAVSDAAPNTFASANYYTWSDRYNLFSLARMADVAVVNHARTEPPAAYQVFVVNVLYYGPCADLDNNGVLDCEEVCEDLDGDEVFAPSALCTVGADCDDNDPNVGASVGDADCDGVPVGEDCDDGDPASGSSSLDADCDSVLTSDDCDDNDPSIGSNAFDGDCDGVPTAADCDDANPALLAVASDADCDGVLTTVDCDDSDPAVTTLTTGDADCDGVPTQLDCDDADPLAGAVANDRDCDGVLADVDCDDSSPAVTTTNVADADCDGLANPIDCGPLDSMNTMTNVGDADCDGVADASDCAPNDATITASRVGDADCDGVPTAVDCDDNDPTVRAAPDANDGDCDGVPTPLDCNDLDRSDRRSRAGDADCDGVPTTLDCDDANAAETRVNTGDLDCDGVASADDCDDRDPRETRSRVGDADCDGTPTGSDCDDADPTVQACPVCLDVDEDGHDARTTECPKGDDCDDDDAEGTTRATDADCDGVITDADCDDEDPESTVVAADADCDSVPTADDCDDEDALLGAIDLDMDCDSILDEDDNCAADFNPDQGDADLDGLGDVCEDCPGGDRDGDFVPDVCDICPDVPDDQQDSVGDGVGDACRDSDGDGVVDSRDNCVASANADQADADRDGKGDVCDDDPPVVTSAEDGGCQTGAPWPAMLLMVGLFAVWRVRRDPSARVV